MSHPFSPRPKPLPKPKKVQKPLKRTPLQKKSKASGELIVFKQIWDERPHVCQVTGTPIKEFNVWCFLHLLSKGAYPKYRLLKENILLVTKDVHSQYDTGHPKVMTPEQLEFLQNKHDELKERYYKFKGQ